MMERDGTEPRKQRDEKREMERVGVMCVWVGCDRVGCDVMLWRREK
jgi:hypothetical protein